MSLLNKQLIGLTALLGVAGISNAESVTSKPTEPVAQQIQYDDSISSPNHRAHVTSVKQSLADNSRE